MIHRTYRSLDQPPKLLGFTLAQWATLIAAACMVGLVVYAAGLAVKVAITLLVLLVGAPATLMYVSETGGLDIGRLCADAVRWRLSPRRLAAVDGQPASRRAPDARRLLPVQSVSEEGLLVRSDGVLVRYLAVSPVNPLVLDAGEAERISAAFAQVATRLEDGQSLQLYALACPVDGEELCGKERSLCERAAAATGGRGEPRLATAIRDLGVLGEESLRQTCARALPMSFTYVVVCPWAPPPRGLRRLRDPGEHDQDLSRRHSEGIRADLRAAGFTAEPLDGSAVLDLLGERLDPARAESLSPPVRLTAPGLAGAPADHQRLAQALCTSPLEVERSQLRLGWLPERSLHVSFPPGQSWLGWLLHLTQSELPFCLSLHVTATERYRERALQRRRYRRVYGVNRGVEARGQMLDPDARLHEQDALELNDELAASAGAGVYRMGIYASFREPRGDREALGEVCRTAGRELTMACDARVGHGQFAQLQLWRSTLPLGRDAAHRSHRYVTANVGDSWPLLGPAASSGEGIVLGVGAPGRSLVRLDPFDRAHPNHLLLINGMSGAGKTMSAIVLLARAISQGATGAIIDRAGHFEYLASLIPGAGTVSLGAGHGDAINCWDVHDAAAAGAEKVDFLLALHALLLGEHHPGRDSYGLTDLEANLLGLAIGEVYARCAQSGERPRELLLQQALDRRHEHERAEGSVGIAEALRNLSLRLSNYVGDGPYAYLADRETTVPPDAPLVVFDTRSIPDQKAAAAMFVICEHVKSRIELARGEHLAASGAAHAWSGRSFLVVDEAWKLIERPATGRWFNEFCRRSRHYALWLVAISQQLSDFENEHGRALLANASMRLFLRQEARELAYVKDTLGLSSEALAAIGELRTVKGSHAEAYVMNGTRGQASVRIGVGPGEYWLASSDPARDEPARRAALREAGGDPWAALSALAVRGASEQAR